MRGSLARWSTLAVTGFAIAGPWVLARPGFDTTDPALAMVAFAPAAYASAIWAPIQMGFLAFALWQVLPAQDANARVVAARPWLLLCALLLVAAVSLASGRRHGLAVAALAALLVGSIGLHRALRICRSPCEGVESWLRIPFSLLAGWLCIALPVALSAELVRVGWDGFGLSATTWGIALVVVSSLFGLVVRFRLDDPVYGFAFVWAYLAIVVQQQENPLVSLFAGIAAALLLVSLFVRGRQPVRRPIRECADV